MSFPSPQRSEPKAYPAGLPIMGLFTGKLEHGRISPSIQDGVASMYVCVSCGFELCHALTDQLMTNTARASAPTIHASQVQAETTPRLNSSQCGTNTATHRGESLPFLKSSK